MHCFRAFVLHVGRFFQLHAVNLSPLNWTKVDNQGYLVAKFLLGDVRAILVPGNNAVTLSGLTVDSGTFTGSTTVRVVK